MLADRPTPAHVTLELISGQTKVGRTARFSPNTQDLSFEFDTIDKDGKVRPAKLLMPAEHIACIGFHKKPSEAVERGVGRKALKVYLTGNKVFRVEAALSDISNPIGFYGIPIGDSPYREVFFYSHGVNAREQEEQLGSMLVEAGVVAPADLQRGIAAQAAGRNVPIGQILIEQRRVTPDAIDEAAQLQKRRKMRIGEVLVEAGLAKPEDIQAALAEQKLRKGKRLGEVLVEMRIVSELDLSLTLAKKFQIPFIDLDQCAINPVAMQQIPRELMAKYGVLPVDEDSKSFTLAISDPLAIEPIDVFRFETKRRIVEVLVTPTQLKQYVAEYLARESKVATTETPMPGMDVILKELAADDLQTAAEEGEEEEKEAGGGESDSGIVKLVNQIIIDAYRKGASDIHIEPNGKERGTIVRFRVDGDCIAYTELPGVYRSPLVARIKILAKLDISERRKPQDGKIRFRLQDKVIELRVATIPTVNNNEDVVLRILAASKPLPLDQMGLSERNLRELRGIISKPYGLVLCVGPTGSGKTTTLHSTLGAINTVDMKIWTAEDPVEITQPGLRQVQVHSKIGFNFAAAMRAFLRADPDVIMVGEMRDLETASTAVEASLTGHLVFSTLHTNSAPETITRLLDMGLDPFSFSDALLGVLAQRLARALCKKCRAKRPGTREEYEEMATAYGKPQWDMLHSPFGPTFQIWEAKGCEACGNSGYKGRLGIHELLVTDDELKHLIAHRSAVEEIRRMSMEKGMTTLLQDGITKSLAGLTDMKQTLAVANR